MDDSQQRPIESAPPPEKILNDLQKVGWLAAGATLGETLRSKKADIDRQIEIRDKKSEENGRRSIIPGIAIGLAAAVGATLFAPAALVLIGGPILAVLGSMAGGAGGYLLGKSSTVDQALKDKLISVNEELDQMLADKKLPAQVWEAFRDTVERVARTISENTPGISTNEILKVFYLRAENPVLTFTANVKQGQKPVSPLEFDISQEMRERGEYIAVQCTELEQRQQTGNGKSHAEIAQRPEQAAEPTPG